MLAHHRKLISLSLTSVDLPLQSTLKTAATLYRKDAERFQVVLKQPPFPDRLPHQPQTALNGHPKDNLLWLELSADRVIMTMQGQGKLGYRHCWEKNSNGTSRYWLQDETCDRPNSLHLKNFTRQLQLSGDLLPDRLRLEYELYSGKLQLGQYILSLEIQH
ncbi:hypothetical protein [Spirulina sp. 06S082]|uniref:hypothetical protein n=1 Tax=Spirulina sp. 06S082 TaxID=3110248 RepID=UPI002B211FED|nr:hypothetical protein [Spirulina sp. 06S082]MEA5467328.1 hypothetical protein [Spirulina sp. 06S082]